MEDVKSSAEPTDQEPSFGPARISGSLEDRLAFLEALMITALQELEGDKAEEIIRRSPHKVDGLPVFYDIQQDYYRAVLGQ
ncbi:hypothetical protein PsAD13_03201 [Pseudovibrio sp. Ad13]|uniref:hypothetical protein n=1 Tax=Pseudovibrio sp. Ad13 TaxID=989396 RepID=UPI0007AEDDDC|nr:hypothetical protein [Pseudovibrio sp. Ad13]KZK82999.1 hypothetical protein PsAD13_03201 [Pseudovibrio sp. Ad13]